MAEDESRLATPQETLQEACESGRPAILFSAGLTRPCAAHFERIADGIVSLEVVSELSETSLQILSLCFVAFHHTRRTRVFIAQVLESEAVGERRVVGLAVPQEIASQEARLALRVPVEHVGGFAVGLRLPDGRELHPDPINLSMSGMLVRFGSSSDPGLAVGAVLSVDVALRGTMVQLDQVIVRRKDAHDYGLFFSNSVKSGRVDPPADLATIVDTLMRDWVRSDPDAS